MKIEETKTSNPKISKKLFYKAIIFIIIVFVLGMTYLFISSNFSKKANAVAQRTAKAQTSDLSTSIAGSGSIISSSKVNIISKTNGTIRTINYKEGDQIKAGAVICSLDTTDALVKVQNDKSNLIQAQLTQKANMSDLRKLNVTAPIEGQITNVVVNEGDIIPKNGNLFTIINTDNIKLTVPFNSNDISGIKLGLTADVNLQNVMESIKGKVTYISNAPYSTINGGEIYNVEIMIKNPGSLTEGIKASADINGVKGSVSSTDVGTLTYTDKIVVRSDTGGIVKKINVRQYEKVKSGAVIIKLQNDDITNAISTTNIKLKDLQNQVTNSETQLGYCTATSPINGIITAINFKQGDSLKFGDILTSVTDTNHMEFDVPVDELDIAKVKVGQNVNVTVDALPQTTAIPLKAIVKVVAVEGTSTNGVTTYPVTVSITGVSNNFASFIRARNGKTAGQGNGNGFRNFNQQSNGNASNNTSARTNVQSTGNAGGSNIQGGSQNSNFSGTRNSNGSQNRNRVKFDPKSLLSGLKDGMNANAEIVITENKGLTTVPLEAISRISGKTYVMVKSNVKTVDELKKNGKYINVFDNTNTSSKNANGSNSNNSGNSSQSSSISSSRNSLKQNQAYYNDAIPTLVEVGVNDDTNIQITSGLKLGQEVVLPPLTLKQSSSNASGNSGLGGILGGGGGQFRNANNQSSGGSSNRSTQNSTKSGGDN